MGILDAYTEGGKYIDKADKASQSQVDVNN